jgi:hypothetical protein
VPFFCFLVTTGTGFRIKDYSVSFTGLCLVCSKKKG